MLLSKGCRRHFISCRSRCRKNIRKLIAIDEFDERNYQLLMQFYIENHRNGKAIETYYELVETLRDELGIEPSEETKQLYQRTLQIANQKQRVSQKTRESLLWSIQ